MREETIYGKGRCGRRCHEKKPNRPSRSSRRQGTKAKWRNRRQG